MLKQVTLVLMALLSFVCDPALAAVPVAPSMNLSFNGQTVTASWTAATGASGYVLYYAPYPNAESIGQAEMGTARSLTVTLPQGAAYYVAIRARNAQGESPYSNIGTVVIPPALQAGDYWEFEWSERRGSSSSEGSSSTGKNGVFRVTLGDPQTLGGRLAFPLVVSGDASVGKPVWNYLANEGSALLGTRDGVTYSTIFGGDAGGWKGAGFFTFFPPDRTNAATAGTYAGNYKTVSASVVARSTAGGGCKFYPEINESICGQDYSSYSESEYEKSGVGPVGYRFSSSALFQGGGFISTSSVQRTIELVKSSRIANDGTAFTGSPWSALPSLARGPSTPDAAAYNGSIFVFGGNWTTDAPPWVQSFDPALGTWNPLMPTGAFVHVTLGVSGGLLYAVGQTSSGSARSLLRYDAAASRWLVAGTPPAFSNPCGGAALASGELVLLDCPGTSTMSIYVYTPGTGVWRRGVNYTSTILRPAIAAVGNDVYVISGFRNDLSGSNDGLVGTVRRYRVATNTWENLPAQIPTPRDSAVAVTIDNKVYVLGGTGRTVDIPAGRVVEILDTVAGTWSTGVTMPQPRSNFAAAVLDGRIYSVGGTESGDTSNTGTTSGFVLAP